MCYNYNEFGEKKGDTGRRKTLIVFGLITSYLGFLPYRAIFSCEVTSSQTLVGQHFDEICNISTLFTHKILHHFTFIVDLFSLSLVLLSRNVQFFIFCKNLLLLAIQREFQLPTCYHLVDISLRDIFCFENLSKQLLRDSSFIFRIEISSECLSLN